MATRDTPEVRNRSLLVHVTSGLWGLPSLYCKWCGKESAMSHPKGIIQMKNRDRCKPLVRVGLILPNKKKTSAERVGLCIITPPSNSQMDIYSRKKSC